MSAPQPSKRRIGKGPIIAMAAVMVLVLVGLAGLLAGRVFFGGDEGEAGEEGGESTTGEPTASETTQPAIRQELHVTAGEGGSGTSEFDPSLPIGYEPTCKGAVEAATNYLSGLDPSKVLAGEVSQEDFIAMTVDRSTEDEAEGAEEELDAMFEQFGDTTAPLADYHPEWGGFSVNQCAEKESAEIFIVSAASFTGPDGYIYTAHTVELEWTDGDWKRSGGGTGDAPATLPSDAVSEPDEQVLTQLGTHSQWENYENAPK
ncbi:hypothetical protein ACTXPC_15530 [Brachybacterium alimentarium]|uniref:hypothetical protein n=1 Tax=Brachybacterium alimentarium TaxID=47845 RepID=UPI0011C01C0E|nr:hypothetical protein [Brachybacterium alimentarium]